MGLSDTPKTIFAPIPLLITRSRTLRRCSDAIALYAEMCAGAAWDDGPVWPVSTAMVHFGKRLGIDKRQLMRAASTLRDVALLSRKSRSTIEVRNPKRLTWGHVVLLWPAYLTETETAEVTGMVAAGSMPGIVAAKLLTPRSSPEDAECADWPMFRSQAWRAATADYSTGQESHLNVTYMSPRKKSKTVTSQFNSTSNTSFSESTSDIIQIREAPPAATPLLEIEKRKLEMTEETKKLIADAISRGKEKEARAKKSNTPARPLIPLEKAKPRATQQPRAVRVEEAGQWTGVEWGRFIHREAVREGKERTPLWIDSRVRQVGIERRMTLSELQSSNALTRAITQKMMTPLVRFVQFFCVEALGSDTPENRVKIALFLRDHLLRHWEDFCRDYLGQKALAEGLEFNPAYLTTAMKKVVQFFNACSTTSRNLDEIRLQQDQRDSEQEALRAQRAAARATARAAQIAALENTEDDWT